MKGLIFYRSHYGNTKQVAEALAAEAGTRGHGSTVQDLRRKLPELADVDFIIIGAPTRMGKVTRKALRVLKRLRKRGFLKPVAVFDTYGPVPANPEELEKARKWLYPGAAGIMLDAAKELGLAVHPTTLRCEVKGMKGPVSDEELAKSRVFVAEFLSSFGR